MQHKRHHLVDFIEFPAKNVKQVQAARDFFETVFAWEYQEWGDDYVDTKSSGVGTGINADASHRPSQALVVIYSKDVEATRAKVIQTGGKITRDIFSFPGGRRFHFRDPTGNELAVWSDK